MKYNHRADELRDLFILSNHFLFPTCIWHVVVVYLAEERGVAFKMQQETF